MCKWILSAAVPLLASLPIATSPASAQAFDAQPGKMFVSIHGLTDQYRKEQKVARINQSILLYRVARSYAEHLARTNAIGHEVDGRTPAKRLEDAGIKHCGVWENVYERWSSPNPVPWETARDGAMKFWKNSPGHNANLLQAKATVVGAASAGWKHGDRYYYKIVQMLADDCQPLDRPIKRLGKRKKA